MTVEYASDALVERLAACPRCAAQPPAQCIGPHGIPLRRPHVARRLLALADTRPRCSAVLITRHTPRVVSRFTGALFHRSRLTGQCTEKAVDRVDGHPVCWVHAQAARNPDRSMPLEYVPELDGTPHPELTP